MLGRYDNTQFAVFSCQFAEWVVLKYLFNKLCTLQTNNCKLDYNPSKWRMFSS